MKLSLESIEVDDRVRRAIGRHYGKPKATRDDVKTFCLAAIDAAIEEVCFELQEEEDR